MAYNNILGQAETYTAGADLSASQFRFVTYASGTVSVTGAGLAAEGVLWNAPTSGDAATVIRGGEPNVWVGAGGLTEGDEVASDANGQAVVAATGNVILGVARTTTAAGGLATVHFYGQAQSVK